MRIASDDTIHAIFNRYFKRNDLPSLAMDLSANFVVQRILGRLTEPQDISRAVNDLLSMTGELIGASSYLAFLILAKSRVTVVTAVLQACTRTNLCCDKARKVFYCQSSLTNLDRRRADI